MAMKPSPPNKMIQSIETAIKSLWMCSDRVFKFESLDEELDALVTWKKISFFAYSPESFIRSSEAICIGAARRGLPVTIVPQLDAEAVLTEMAIYVCRDTETWRIPALRDLMNQMLESKRGWTDDLERVQARLLGYSSEDAEAWIRQNYEIRGYWTGCKRVFIGFEVSGEDAHTIALRRAFPDSMDHWWVVSMPETWRIRPDPVLPMEFVVRAALRVDPMLDAYAEGELVTFPALDGVKARRVRSSGSELNAKLYADLDLVSPRGRRP